MQMAGYLPFGQGISDITGFAQDSREYAVVGLFYDAAAIVDITDPLNPVELGRISGATNTWRDLKYWNRHVYIGTEAGDGVKVINVDNPDSPILVHTITDITHSHNIHIDVDGFLYIVGADEHDIWIYDLAIPSEPILVSTWDGEYLHDIEVYNNKVYGAGITSGNFNIIDVSDKSNPTTILSHNTGVGSGTHDCAVTTDEKYLITADEFTGGHIKIWDISDYDNINLVSEYMTHPSHSVHNIYVRPETNLLIASYYVDGTRVLDISDPANPVEVGYFDTTEEIGLFDGNWGTYVDLPSGYIISSDRQNGIFILASPLIPSSPLQWSDCSGVVGNNADCYGEIYQIESNILQELIDANPELSGVEPEDIGKFVAGMVVELNLSDRDLTALSIPNNLLNLNNLTTIQLGGNQLTVFPDGILNLTALTELDFSENLLTTLPAAIDTLSNLEELNLSDNNFTSFPTSVCNLPEDCRIDISRNHLCTQDLQSVGECISTIGFQYCDQCSSGYYLNGHCCFESDLNVLQAFIDLNDTLSAEHPLELGKPHLVYSTWSEGRVTYFDLSDYNLTSIPYNISQLTNLRELNLINNSIASLPAGIVEMDSLRILRLHNNLFTELPENIGNLILLEELYLSGNLLNTLPESIGNLINLQKLFITDNQLTSLPETICNLPEDCNIQTRNNCIAGEYVCISDLGDQNNCPAMEIVDYQPNMYQLFTPYPNPFNPVTSISFFLPYSGFTYLQILDINGRLIKTIQHQFMSSGYHTVNWNASAQSSGVYLVQMGIGNPQTMNNEKIIQTRKMVLLK